MRMIEVKDLSKDFGDVHALSHVDLCFEENTIYGLLGRNGAGKSTLLNIINNRLFPSSGSVTFDGTPVTENAKNLSQFYLANEDNLYPEGMKVKDAFLWSKEFYPGFDTNYAYKLCGLFELSPKKKIKKLSTGYRSIFRNIVALSVNVPFVFLDEPVLGLDAYHRELFYKTLIEKYAENPFTAVISTHLIEEVAGVLEKVIIIKEGAIIRDTSAEKLLQAGYCISGPANLVDSYVKRRDLIGYDVLGGLKTAYIIGKPDESIPEGLEVGTMDLQKLFIQLTSA